MKTIQQRLIVGGKGRWLDPASAAIAWFGSGFSHVDSVVPAGLDWGIEGWLYGARSDVCAGVPAGVQLRPPDYAGFWRCVLLTIPVTDQQWQDFWAAERAKFGLPYDWRAIWAFAFARDWHEPDSWICSEKNEDSFEKAKILPPFYLAPNKITPGLLGARIEVLPGVTFEEIPQPARWARRGIM